MVAVPLWLIAITIVLALALGFVAGWVFSELTELGRSK